MRWFYYPIVMPLSADGNGPASVEKGEARKLTWEVWDQEFTTHGSFEILSDAIDKAMELNAKLADSEADAAARSLSPRSRGQVMVTDGMVNAACAEHWTGWAEWSEFRRDKERGVMRLSLEAALRAETAEARVKEIEAERDAHKEGRLEAIVEAYPDIAAVIEKIGRVEWGATVEQSDEAHIEDFANTLRLTREHFGTPEQTAKHGVYVEGTGVVVCHTGTSPNSGQHARVMVGLWNELADALAARSLSQIKEAGR